MRRARRNKTCQRVFECLEARSTPAADLLPLAVHHWSFDDGPDWHDSAPGAVAPAITADVSGRADARSATGDPLPFVTGTQRKGVDMAALGRPLVLDADIRSSLGGPFTVAFWVLTTARGDAAAAAAPAVLGTAGIGLGALDAEGRIGVAVGAHWVAVSQRPIDDGQWHFVAITRNARYGRIEVAVDDGPIATGLRAATPTGLPVTAIGGRSGTVAAFPGRLDQVSVFRSRLSRAALAVLRDNHAPKTWGITAAGTAGREFRTASVLVSAYDVEGDRLRVRRFTQPAHGRARHLGDGSFVIIPDRGFVGRDRMTIVVGDGRGGLSRSTIDIDVLPVPPAGGRAAAFVDFAPVVAGDAVLRTESAWRVPRAVDFDRDGRVDLLVAADRGIAFHRNVGSVGRAVFAAGVPVLADGEPIRTADFAALALADMTGDGRLDIVLPDASGVLLVYANTSVAAGTMTVTMAGPLRDDQGDPFVVPDQRFDVGDYDNDGLSDVVVGTFAGDVQLFVNRGTAVRPEFARDGVALMSDAYNLFPRIVDVSRNGVPDLLLGVNWGTVRSWLDPALHGGSLATAPPWQLIITDSTGAVPDLHALTDGPVVDVADVDGDGVVDLVIGGQLAGDAVYVAHGRAASVAEELRFLGSVWRAHPTGLGAVLDADGGRLLARVRASLGRIVDIVKTAGPEDRARIWSAYAAHVRRFARLRMDRPVDVTTEHHLPGIIAQYAVTAGHILPDAPRQRAAIADLFGMQGHRRQLYVGFRLVLGDNVRASDGQLATLVEFMRHQPRATFPDDIVTIDSFSGDGPGGLVALFTGGKNTFGDPTGTPSDEWPDDIRTALAAAKPGNATAGDLFTFVVGHEATHSLDAYVRGRANRDLARRWGQMLCHAAGDDVVAGADGWIDWAATQARFRDRGLWDGAGETWPAAWQAYWSVGPGATLRDTSFLRGGIDWFLENPQESLATQGNQHWVDSEGRLLGAVDRFRRGVAAPLTEAVTFLDFVSVGLNRVAMFDIDPDSVRGRAVWKIAYADLRRDARGFINEVRMSDSGRTYRFTVDASGIYRDVAVTERP
jgi:hypothetical protein